jgi:hypothetical protein
MAIRHLQHTSGNASHLSFRVTVRWTVREVASESAPQVCRFEFIPAIRNAFVWRAFVSKTIGTHPCRKERLLALIPSLKKRGEMVWKAVPAFLAVSRRFRPAGKKGGTGRIEFVSSTTTGLLAPLQHTSGNASHLSFRITVRWTARGISLNSAPAHPVIPNWKDT